MKRLLLFLCALTLFLGITGISSATIIYTDTYNPAPDKYLTPSNPTTSWTHSIVVDQDGAGSVYSGTPYGFNPATQDVTSASIRLWFSDDSIPWNDPLDWFGATEEVQLNIGTNVFNWEVDTGNLAFTVTSLISLNTSGTIAATLTATSGDFYFQQATLTANASDPPPSAPVPEPGTLLLLGSGLIGLIGYGKFRLHLRKKMG